MAVAEAVRVKAPRPMRWSRDEYYRLAGMGLFNVRGVELIDGEVIEMSPQYAPHTTALVLTQRALAKAFPEGRYTVRPQVPLSIGGRSDPEPDIAVVEGAPRDFSGAHPGTALLAVEIAETSLEYDRSTKASLYASAGIKDYWIINLNDKQIEVHRDPVPDADQPHGATYTSVTAVRPEGSISPLAAPEAQILVADLLP